MKKLLFVCMGNICRSPAAEGVMKDLVLKAGLQDEIICDSAGTLGYHAGSSPDSRMTAHAKKRGIYLEHAARKFVFSDFKNFDHILVMDKDNFSNVVALDPEGSFLHKVQYLTDFCQKIKAAEVPDPYYGGASGFDLVLDIVTDACEGLLKKIK